MKRNVVRVFCNIHINYNIYSKYIASHLSEMKIITILTIPLLDYLNNRNVFLSNFLVCFGGPNRRVNYEDNVQTYGIAASFIFYLSKFMNLEGHLCKLISFLFIEITSWLSYFSTFLIECCSMHNLDSKRCALVTFLNLFICSVGFKCPPLPNWLPSSASNGMYTELTSFLSNYINSNFPWFWSF